MEVFRTDVWQSRKTQKIGHFFGPGGHNFDFSEKLTEIVPLSFFLPAFERSLRGHIGKN